MELQSTERRPSATYEDEEMFLPDEQPSDSHSSSDSEDSNSKVSTWRARLPRRQGSTIIRRPISQSPTVQRLYGALVLRVPFAVYIPNIDCGWQLGLVVNVDVTAVGRHSFGFTFMCPARPSPDDRDIIANLKNHPEFTHKRHLSTPVPLQKCTPARPCEFHQVDRPRFVKGLGRILLSNIQWQRVRYRPESSPPKTLTLDQLLTKEIRHSRHCSVNFENSLMKRLPMKSNHHERYDEQFHRWQNWKNGNSSLVSHSPASSDDVSSSSSSLSTPHPTPPTTPSLAPPTPPSPAPPPILSSSSSSFSLPLSFSTTKDLRQTLELVLGPFHPSILSAFSHPPVTDNSNHPPLVKDSPQVTEVVDSPSPPSPSHSFVNETTPESPSETSIISDPPPIFPADQPSCPPSQNQPTDSRLLVNLGSAILTSSLLPDHQVLAEKRIQHGFPFALLQFDMRSSLTALREEILKHRPGLQFRFLLSLSRGTSSSRVFVTSPQEDGLTVAEVAEVCSLPSDDDERQSAKLNFPMIYVSLFTLPSSHLPPLRS